MAETSANNVDHTIAVDTTGIDAAAEHLRATKAQAKQTLDECMHIIERANAITPANA